MSESSRRVYRIKLTGEERDAFEEVAKGKRGKLNIARWKVQRATAMLKCHESEGGSAWADRNRRQRGINWQFTNEKARLKLRRLYPKIELW
jgi:hypothetical protein